MFKPFLYLCGSRSLLTTHPNDVCFVLINHYSGFPRTISNSWNYLMQMRTNVPDYLKDVLITYKVINMWYMEISTQWSQCKKALGYSGVGELQFHCI